MANKTQIRLTAVTSSFGTSAGQINDQLSAVTTGSMAAGDLAGVLSNMASAIKRIHGGDSFSQAVAGEFNHALSVDTIQEKTSAAGVTIDGVKLKDSDVIVADGGTVGSASSVNAISIASTGIVTFVDDIIIKDAGTIGSVSDPDAIAIAAGGDVTLTQDLRFADGKEIGSSTTSDLMTINANDVKIKAGKDLLVDEILESTSAAGVTIDGAKIKDGSLIIADGGNIGSASDVDAIAISSGGDVSLSQDLKFADGKLLGSTTTADLVTVNANDLTIKGTKTLKVDIIGESTSAAGVVIDGVVLKDNDIIIPDGSTIGSATTPAAITIASNGKVTLSGDLEVDGTTTTVDTTNLLVKDKLITLNDGGSASSAGGAGIEFEEDGSATGYIKTAADRAGFEFNAPANNNVLTVDTTTSAATVTVGADLTVEGASVINQDLTTDATPTFGAAVIAGSGNGIRFNDNDNSNYVQLMAPSTVGTNVILTLPVDDGASGQALLTDGNGVLSFGAPAAGAIAADDITAGDSNVLIKTSASNAKLELEANTGMGATIAMTASMGIKMNPGAQGVAIMRPVGASGQSNQGGFISAMAGQIGDNFESLTINGQDNLYLSSSLGQVWFVGKSQFGAAQPFFLIASGASGQAILSGTQHGQSMIFNGASGNEMFRVHQSNGVSIPSSKTFSFNGDTNTMKISANGGNQLNIMGPDKIVVDANAGIELNADNGTIEMKDDTAALFTFNAAGIANGSGNCAIDVVGDIELNADGGNITLKDGSDTMVDFVANGTTYVTLDAPGDIRLDAGGMDVNLLAGGTEFGRLSDDGSANFALFSAGSDKDMIFKGNDGGSTITALTLDMSEAGAATFNSSVTAGSAGFVRGNTSLTDGSLATAGASTNITIDSGNDIILDADGDNITFKAGSDAAVGLDFSWDNSNSLWKMGTLEEDSGIVLSARGNGSQAIEALRVVGDGSSSVYARMASGIQMQFGGNGSRIQGDGTNLTLATNSGQIQLESEARFSNAGMVVADTGGSDASTPASGYGVFFVKGDKPYFKSDGGTVMDLTQVTGITGSHPTKVQYTVTGTHAANNDLNITSGVGYANWNATGGHGNAGEEYVDVYVNGQLLLSGAAGSTASADYVLMEKFGNRGIKFAFTLEADDLVTVKRIRQA